MQIGPYTIERELGRGGMGAVYLGHLAGQSEPVAVKVIHSSLARDLDLLARFEREGDVLGRLRHPNLVRLRGRGTFAGGLWLAMDYVAGETLEARLKAGGAWPSHAAGDLILALSQGVAAAHAAGVLHRDLKPENILIRAIDGAPMIVDFGLALPLDQSQHLTQTGQLLGSPGFMAPEQCGGGQGTSPATDVYGLGAVLYNVLTGQPPHVASSVLATLDLILNSPPRPPRDLVPGVDPGLEAVCLRALAKAPSERYRDAGQLVAALEEQSASPTRGPAAGLLALLVLAVLGLGAGISLHFAGEAPPASSSPVIAAPSRAPLPSPSAESPGETPGLAPADPVGGAGADPIEEALSQGRWAEVYDQAGDVASLRASWLRYRALEAEVDARLEADAGWTRRRERALRLAQKSAGSVSASEKPWAGGLVALLGALRETTFARRTELGLAEPTLALALAEEAPGLDPAQHLALARARALVAADRVPFGGGEKGAASERAQEALDRWVRQGAEGWRLALLEVYLAWRRGRAEAAALALDRVERAAVEWPALRQVALFLRFSLDSSSMDYMRAGDVHLLRRLVESADSTAQVKARSAVTLSLSLLSNPADPLLAAESAEKLLDQAPLPPCASPDLTFAWRAARIGVAVRRGRFAEAVSLGEEASQGEAVEMRFGVPADFVLWKSLAEACAGSREAARVGVGSLLRVRLQARQLLLRLEVAAVAGDSALAEGALKVKSLNLSFPGVYHLSALGVLDRVLSAQGAAGTPPETRAKFEALRKRFLGVLHANYEVVLDQHLELGLWRRGLEISLGEALEWPASRPLSLRIRQGFWILVRALDESRAPGPEWKRGHARLTQMARGLDLSRAEHRGLVAALASLVAPKAEWAGLRETLSTAVQTGLGWVAHDQALVSLLVRCGEESPEDPAWAFEEHCAARAWLSRSPKSVAAALAVAKNEEGRWGETLELDLVKQLKDSLFLHRATELKAIRLVKNRRTEVGGGARALSVVCLSRSVLNATRRRLLLQVASYYLATPGRGADALAAILRLEAVCGAPPEGFQGPYLLAKSRALAELGRPDLALARAANSAIAKHARDHALRSLAAAHLGRLEVQAGLARAGEGEARIVAASKHAATHEAWLEAARGLSGEGQARAYREVLASGPLLGTAGELLVEIAAAGLDPTRLCHDVLNVLSLRRISGVPLARALYSRTQSPEASLVYCRAILLHRIRSGTKQAQLSSGLEPFQAALGRVPGSLAAVIAAEVKLLEVGALFARGEVGLEAVNACLQRLRSSVAGIEPKQADELSVAKLQVQTLALLRGRTRDERGLRLLSEASLEVLRAWYARSRNPLAGLWFAQSLREVPRLEEARRTLEHALEGPNAAYSSVRASLEFELGCLLDKLDEVGRAEAVLRSGLQHAAQDSRTRILLAISNLLLREGDAAGSVRAATWGLASAEPGAYRAVGASRMAIARGRAAGGEALGGVAKELEAVRAGLSRLRPRQRVRLGAELDVCLAMANRLNDKPEVAKALAERARQALAPGFHVEATCEWLHARALLGERPAAIKEALALAEAAGRVPVDRRRFRELAQRLGARR